MNNISSSLKEKNIKVITRNEIPALKSVTVDNDLHNLGLLLDFRKNKDLLSFIPDQARLSLSWVHLNSNEVLNVHAHPTCSMIIITEGEGMAMGDIQRPLKTGDIVIVPPFAKHGFIGKGKSGFWGISIQFEGLGLYENPQKSRVEFIKKVELSDPIALLEKDQIKHESKFRKGQLMKLSSSDLIRQTEVQNRLLEALNFWSDWFQRILAARVAAGNPRDYQDLAEEHFAEEVGHNKSLLKMRHEHPITFWDPILDATSSWFYQRILTGTPEERTILMHCVLESASCIFHSKAEEIFPSSHFSIHSELDQEHSKEGFIALRAHQIKDIEPLRKCLREGWEMTGKLTAAMAHYAKQGK